MKLTVSTMADELFVFDVSDDLELENFKFMCELETSIPARELLLIFNGRPLLDNAASLSSYGIRDGDVLVVRHLQGISGQTAGGTASGGRALSAGGRPAAGAPQIDFSQVHIPGAGQPQGFESMSEDPATLRELLLSSPHDVALLKERNPPLAEALLSGNLEKFTEVLRRQQQQDRADRDRERLRLFSADPFDAEAQLLIAEEVRLKNVEHNMETAMEHSPESFVQVTMLYIDCSVNGHPVKALINPGSEITIMSQTCAERCNIMRLIDTRWAGLAKGVGTQKIIGRVHLSRFEIENDSLSFSPFIDTEQSADMIIGLEIMKLHQFIINLKDNELVIGMTDTHTPFLSEAELPENARLNRTRLQANMIEESESKTRGHSFAVKFLKQKVVPSHVINLATLQNRLYLLSSPPYDEPFITTYSLTNFDELNRIDLDGIGVECMVSDPINSSIFLLSKGPMYRSICRINNPLDERRISRIEPFIAGISVIANSVVRLSTSLGQLLVLTSNLLPNLSSVSIYNKSGFVTRQVSLSPMRLHFTGVFGTNINSRGNIVAAMYHCSNDGLVELVEVGARGQPLSRYKSAMYGDIDVTIGKERFYLSADEFEGEVVDEDFNQLLRSPKPKDPSKTYHISCGSSYNEANDMVIRLHKVIEDGGSKVVTISRLMKV